MMRGVPLEIQQHCLEVKSCLRGKKGGGGEHLAVLLLGRALEVPSTTSFFTPAMRSSPDLDF